MTGQPGRSGGARPGAGPRVRTRTLRTGQALLFHETNAQGEALDIGKIATVEVVSRTKIILVLDDGNRIVLGY